MCWLYANPARPRQTEGQAYLSVASPGPSTKSVTLNGVWMRLHCPMLARPLGDARRPCPSYRYSGPRTTPGPHNERFLSSASPTALHGEDQGVALSSHHRSRKPLFTKTQNEIWSTRQQFIISPGISLRFRTQLYVNHTPPLCLAFSTAPTRQFPIGPIGLHVRPGTVIRLSR